MRAGSNPVPGTIISLIGVFFDIILISAIMNYMHHKNIFTQSY